MTCTPWSPRKADLPDHVVQVGAISKCRGTTCGREVGWAKTRDEQWQPFDLTVDPETGKHLPHHMTCPDAAEFRKRKTARSGRS